MARRSDGPRPAGASETRTVKSRAPTRRFASLAVIASPLALAGGAGAMTARGANMEGTDVALTPQDQLDLMSLPARYGNAMDDRDWNALRAIFTHDASFEVLPAKVRLEGLEAIIAYMDAVAVHPLSHLMLNVALETRGAGVELRSRGLLPFAEAPGAGGLYRVTFGFYYDSVVKTREGWRISRRLFTRAPRDMKPTKADLTTQHGLVKLLEADRRDAAEMAATGKP